MFQNVNKKGLIRLAAVLLALWLGAFPALAQEGRDETWPMRCMGQGQSYCEIFQRLIEKDSGVRVAEFAIGFPEGSETARGAIILPLGIVLTEKSLLQVDEDGTVYGFDVRYCTQEGCFGFIDVGPDLLREMKMGGALNISFITMQGEAYTVELNLMGFTAALDKLNAT